MILKEDIRSSFHDKHGPILLGTKGEKVSLISDHGNILIVQGKKGKFSVAKDKVCNQP